METRGRDRIRVLKDSCEMHSPMLTGEDKSGARRNVYVKTINKICTGNQISEISNEINNGASRGDIYS